MEKILIVEDDQAQQEMMVEALSIEGYQVEKASNAKEAIEKVQTGFDLALLDINLPDGTGIDVLRKIKQQNRDAEVVMVTGERDVDTAVRCLKMGAYDYITKPFELDELVIIVKRALEHTELSQIKKAQKMKVKEELKRLKTELRNSYLESVNMLIDLIEIRDHYTDGHAKKVAKITAEIAKEMGLSKESTEDIRIASLLHDLGKMGIPEIILSKSSKLTDEEMVQVQKHPVVSANIISKFLGPEVIGYVRSHHERWDGSGYPDGLNGEDIPIGARIIAVADVYDAMTSDRAYRKAMSREEAMKIIQDNSGKLFDPNVVRAFTKVMA